MANFDFDLETAELKLECINNLLGVFLEFWEEECPLGETIDKYDRDHVLSALIFTARSHQFESLIRAAKDKVFELRKDMETAIEKYFNESKKEGGEVA